MRKTGVTGNGSRSGGGSVRGGGGGGGGSGRRCFGWTRGLDDRRPRSIVVGVDDNRCRLSLSLSLSLRLSLRVFFPCWLWRSLCDEINTYII